MRGTSIGTMRYLFFGVGLVGGVILLAAGETLIGGLLVAMAAVRLVLLVSMQRRMRSSSSPSRGMNGRPGGGRQMLQRLAGMELDVAATAIGVAPDVLRSAVNNGRSISAVAADAGVPSDRVVDAVVRDANAKVDRAVADGRMASDRASMLASLAQLGRNWCRKRRRCSPEPDRVPDRTRVRTRWRSVGNDCRTTARSHP